MYLNNITIDNARRFGNNVNIEFGEGATILLAPNGTGKTTIFEALELAITGRIERLSRNQRAIISNGAKNMHIKLDFSDSSRYEVTYDKNGTLNKTGDIREILNIDKDVAIDYMYRMTHFFEQSDKNWFVASSEDDAGSVLNTLPIAKDLQTILLKKTSLYHSITNIQDEIQDKLAIYQKDYNIINNLVSKRENLQSIKPKLTISNVNNEVVKLAQKYSLQDYFITEDINENNKYLGNIKIIFNDLKEKNMNVISSIDSFSEKLSFYYKNEDKMSEILQQISNKQKENDSINKDKDSLVLFVDQLNNKLAMLNEELSKKTMYISRCNELDKLTNQVTQSNNDLQIANTQLNEYETLLNEINTYLNKNKQIKNSHKILNDSLIKKNNDLQVCLEKVRILDTCISMEKQKEILSADNTENVVISKGIFHDIEENRKVFNIAETIYEQAKKARELIKTSNQEISDSITNIKKHIHKDQKFCPVCQAEYDHDELLKRIEKSLNALNPLLIEAIKAEENAKGEYVKAKEVYDSSNSKLNSINLKIQNNNTKISSINDSINSMLNGFFSMNSDYNRERVKVQEDIGKINNEIGDLHKQEESLVTEEPVENVMKEQLHKEEFSEKVKEIKAIISETETEIASGKKKIDRLKSSLEELKSECKSDDIEDIQKKIDILKNCINNKKNSIRHQNERLNDLKSILNSYGAELSELKSLQAGIDSSWSTFNINGKPSDKMIKLKREEVIKENNDITADIDKLLYYEQILSQWLTFFQFEAVNSEIKSIIGENTLEVYINKLVNDIKRMENKRDSVVDKRAAVEFLMDSLTNESRKIQNQLQSINNDWSEILKRIITNPIIADATLLDSKITRNKAKANILTNINNAPTNIASVASEGQMTDLQLSFILSMAKKYTWTSWKALLLDDPVQHHDLVHSASVLDLLRDFISNFGYQVLFSTHDELQAKFFSRKLLNEGISNKIYYLKDTKQGVVAELL